MQQLRAVISSVGPAAALSRLQLLPVEAQVLGAREVVSACVERRDGDTAKRVLDLLGQDLGASVRMQVAEAMLLTPGLATDSLDLVRATISEENKQSLSRFITRLLNRGEASLAEKVTIAVAKTSGLSTAIVDVPFIEMLTWFAADPNRTQLGLEFSHRLLRDKLVVSSAVYNQILQLLAVASDVRSAEKLFKEFRELHGFDGHSTMMKLYAIRGNAESTMRLLDESRFLGNATTTKMWDQVVRAYALSSSFGDALLTLNQMRNRGFPPTITTYGILIDQYVAQGDTGGAIKCFEKMKAEGIMPTSKHYAAIISSLLKEDYWKPAFARFVEMGRNKIKPEPETYDELLLFRLDTGKLKEVREIWYTARKNKSAVTPTQCWVYIEMQKRAKGEKAVQTAKEHLRRSGVKLSADTYARLIRSAESTRQAWAEYRELVQAEVEPNIAVYNALLSVHMMRISQASVVVRCIQRAGLKANDETWVVLMRLRGKQRDIAGVHDAFQRIQTRTKTNQIEYVHALCDADAIVAAMWEYHALKRDHGPDPDLRSKLIRPRNSIQPTKHHAIVTSPSPTIDSNLYR